MVYASVAVVDDGDKETGMGCSRHCYCSSQGCLPTTISSTSAGCSKDVGLGEDWDDNGEDDEDDGDGGGGAAQRSAVRRCLPR